jgi:hypothetical protein
LHSGQIVSVIFVSSLVAPLRDQPAALVCWHFELLDRLLDSTLLVRSVNDANELSWRPADVW